MNRYYLDADDHVVVDSGSESDRSQSGHEMTGTTHSHIHRFGKRKGYTATTGDEEAHLGETISLQEQAANNFLKRQNRAATCWRQLLTVSTLIIISQIAAFVYIVKRDGFAPRSDNPMYGPSAQTLIDFGAKQAGFILYKRQWWRLITPIFLHAGVFHIFPNVLIQWQVGGYLYLLWGTIPWLLIYFISGVYGNILSCIAEPDAVGVGSSGSLMGILGAWAVFLLYTWNKIPEQCRKQRNQQLCSVSFCIIVTISLSFLKFVDGAAHMGGMMQGCLLAMILLSGEIDSCCIRWLMRAISLAAVVISFIVVLSLLLTSVEPSRELVDEYDHSDDDENDNY